MCIRDSYKDGKTGTAFEKPEIGLSVEEMLKRAAAN